MLEDPPWCTHLVLLKQIHKTVAAALELNLYGRGLRLLLGKPPQMSTSKENISVRGCVEVASFQPYFNRANCIVLYCTILYFIILDRVSWTVRWPQTHYVAENNLSDPPVSTPPMLYCRYIPWGYPEWQMKLKFSCLQSKPSISGDTGPYDSSTLLQNSTAKHFVQDAHDSIVPLLCLCLVARQSWPQTTCELVLVTGDASGPAFFFTGKLCYQFSLLSVLDSLPTVYISWWICVGWFCFQEFSTWFASSNFLFCDCYGHLLLVVPTCICTQVSSSTSPPYPLEAGSVNEPGVHWFEPGGQASKLSKSIHPLCRG